MIEDDLYKERSVIKDSIRSIEHQEVK